MNGAQHYREAERLADAARADVRDADLTSPAGDASLIRAHVALEAAQVHATLALAAATAVPAANAYDGDEDHSRTRGWAGVA